MSNFSVFYNNQVGNRCELSGNTDPNNPNSGALWQCMDLAYELVFCHFIPKVTIQHQYARQVYTSPNALTRQFFEIIPNTLINMVQTGDLVVYDLGVAGHIDIATGEGDVKTFKSFSQNWGTDKRPRIVTHDYERDKVMGWLRIKDEYKRV